MPRFRTLVAVVDVEIPRIKGSRFLARAAPAQTETDAFVHVEAMRQDYPDARHHCFAWRLGDHQRRTWDDGEPSGTAGGPILNRILGAGLHQVVVIVTRYFGGTKLGMGGLVRAYGTAAQAALDAAAVHEFSLSRRVAFAYPYDLSGSIQRVLAAWNLEPDQAEYGVDVRLSVSVPVENIDDFERALGEATAGRVVLDSG